MSKLSEKISELQSERDTILQSEIVIDMDKLKLMRESKVKELTELLNSSKGVLGTKFSEYCTNILEIDKKIKEVENFTDEKAKKVEALNKKISKYEEAQQYIENLSRAQLKGVLDEDIVYKEAKKKGYIDIIEKMENRELSEQEYRDLYYQDVFNDSVKQELLHETLKKLSQENFLLESPVTKEEMIYKIFRKVPVVKRGSLPNFNQKYIGDTIQLENWVDIKEAGEYDVNVSLFGIKYKLYLSVTGEKTLEKTGNGKITPKTVESLEVDKIGIKNEQEKDAGKKRQSLDKEEIKNRFLVDELYEKFLREIRAIKSSESDSLKQRQKLGGYLVEYFQNVINHYTDEDKPAVIVAMKEAIRVGTDSATSGLFLGNNHEKWKTYWGKIEKLCKIGLDTGGILKNQEELDEFDKSIHTGYEFHKILKKRNLVKKNAYLFLVKHLENFQGIKIDDIMQFLSDAFDMRVSDVYMKNIFSKIHLDCKVLEGEGAYEDLIKVINEDFPHLQKYLESGSKSDSLGLLKRGVGGSEDALKFISESDREKCKMAIKMGFFRELDDKVAISLMKGKKTAVLVNERKFVYDNLQYFRGLTKNIWDILFKIVAEKKDVDEKKECSVYMCSNIKSFNEESRKEIAGSLIENNATEAVIRNLDAFQFSKEDEKILMQYIVDKGQGKVILKYGYKTRSKEMSSETINALSKIVEDLSVEDKNYLGIPTLLKFKWLPLPEGKREQIINKVLTYLERRDRLEEGYDNTQVNFNKFFLSLESQGREVCIKEIIEHQKYFIRYLYICLRHNKSKFQGEFGNKVKNLLKSIGFMVENIPDIFKEEDESTGNQIEESVQGESLELFNLEEMNNDLKKQVQEEKELKNEILVNCTSVENTKKYLKTKYSGGGSNKEDVFKAIDKLVIGKDGCVLDSSWYDFCDVNELNFDMMLLIAIGNYIVKSFSNYNRGEALNIIQLEGKINSLESILDIFNNPKEVTESLGDGYSREIVEIQRSVFEDALKKDGIVEAHIIDKVEHELYHRGGVKIVNDEIVEITPECETAEERIDKIMDLELKKTNSDETFKIGFVDENYFRKTLENKRSRLKSVCEKCLKQLIAVSKGELGISDETAIDYVDKRSVSEPFCKFGYGHTPYRILFTKDRTQLIGILKHSDYDDVLKGKISVESVVKSW